MLNKINNPILFQGDLKNKNYFEGWYFKQVSADCNTVLSLIPGISLFVEDPHCFVQYIYKNIDENGIHILKTGYCRYPASRFSFSQNPFEIRVGDSTFSEREITINLQDGDFEISGVLELGDFNFIEKSLLMPNIMGFFAYIPKMQCYHGIISMDHTLKGEITITTSVPDSGVAKGAASKPSLVPDSVTTTPQSNRLSEMKIDFTNGKGYIEKDWGTSFPKEYIWGQCNHFNDDKTGLVFSIADIPFANTSFKGFLCNLFINNKEYRFATYNASKCKIDFLSHQRAVLKFENKNARLEIEALISNPGELIAPVLGNMIKPIKEELSGDVNFTLFDKKTQKLYTECGKMAGIEIVIEASGSKLL
jgi:tocopherol cyclase